MIKPFGKYDAKELRLMEVSAEERRKQKKNPVYIVLDNVLDTYNIGSVFRLADAVAASKVYLCAGSETPPNHRIKKASINTTEWVEWEYTASVSEAIERIKKQESRIKVFAIEQDESSIPYTEANYSFPIALVVGHETDGVSQEAIEASDVVVELPMWGVNKSMNVVVSLAIVLFEAMKHYE